MQSNPDHITFALELPPYLRQWLAFAMGGAPVAFPRGSAFNSFLRVFLRHKRESENFLQSSPDDIRIIVPKFPGKDPVYHNFLPLRARKALAELIRDAFDVQLFRELNAFRNVSRKQNEVVMLWMEENGIEVDDRNYCSVIKRLQLLRSRQSDRERKRRQYAGKKNNSSQS